MPAAPRSALLAAAVALAAFAVFLPGLGARDFWAPDEARFAAVSRTMLGSGDWVLPYFAGQPLALLPPLTYWGSAAAAAVAGEGLTEGPARFPIVLAAVLTLLACFLFGRTISGDAAGVAAAAALATTALFAWQARFLQADMLLLAAVTWTLVLFYRGYQDPARRTTSYLLMGVAAGLGTLAKGPVSVAVPGLVALAFLALRRDFGALLFTRGFLAGLASYFVVVVPWYALVFLAKDGGSTFLREILLKHNLGMFFETWSHKRPFWYYAANVPWGLLPWTLVLPAAIVYLVRRTAAPDARTDRLFLLCWAIAPVIFFSISQAKQAKYILPAVPPLAIALGVLVGEAREAATKIDLRRLFEWPLAAIAALLGLAGAALALLPFVAPSIRLESEDAAQVLRAIADRGLLGGIVIFGASALGLVAARRGQVQLLFTHVVLGCLLLVLAGGTALFPALNVAKSPRELCRRIDALPVPGAPLGIYAIGVRQQGGYRFYSTRPIERFVREGQEDEDETEGFVGNDPNLLYDRLRREEPIYVLIEWKDAERLKAGIAPLATTVIEDGVGSKRLVVLANRAACRAGAGPWRGS